MATTISIKVGALTVERTFENDVKAGETLRLFAEGIGVAPESTNKQKLQFVLDELVERIARGSRKEYLRQREAEHIAESEAIGLE